MSLRIESEPSPLVAGADGIVRVGGTRVTLDSLAAAFAGGATAEEMASRYPSLRLADIYTAIAYCLRHPQTVEVYLAERAEQAALVRTQNERRWDPDGVRGRLLARNRR